jgi:hypothetical protein
LSSRRKVYNRCRIDLAALDLLRGVWRVVSAARIRWIDIELTSDRRTYEVVALLSGYIRVAS